MLKQRKKETAKQILARKLKGSYNKNFNNISKWSKELKPLNGESPVKDNKYKLDVVGIPPIITDKKSKQRRKITLTVDSFLNITKPGKSRDI